LKASKIKIGDKNILEVEVKYEQFAFEKAGYKAASRIVGHLKKGKRTGIFALMSDQVACGAIKRLQEENETAKEVVICGYDNMSESSEWANNFTSIDSSISDVGYRGALILLKNIESGSSTEPTREILPVKLIKRESL
jgi:DNA-binding LacI/PurR family transcriptional regulator